MPQSSEVDSCGAFIRHETFFSPDFLFAERDRKCWQKTVRGLFGISLPYRSFLRKYCKTASSFALPAQLAEAGIISFIRYLILYSFQAKSHHSTTPSPLGQKFLPLTTPALSEPSKTQVHSYDTHAHNPSAVTSRQSPSPLSTSNERTSSSPQTSFPTSLSPTLSTTPKCPQKMEATTLLPPSFSPFLFTPPLSLSLSLSQQSPIT